MLTIRVARPPEPTDLALARSLEAAASEVDRHESFGAAVWRDLESPGPESFSLIATDDESPAGFLHCFPSDSFSVPHRAGGIVIPPSHRENGVVARALLEAAVNELEREGGQAQDARPFVVWVPGADDTTDATFASVGFTREREQLQMRVDLPLEEVPRWPDGVSVRAFRPGEDEDAWLHVNNRAFRQHPDQGGWVRDTLLRREAEAWFDPEGFLLAFDTEGLAGFCWTKVHDERDPASRLGEIFVIGVDPDRQGTGLGRALVVAGLEHLERVRSCPTGLLYVDGANEAALRLVLGTRFQDLARRSRLRARRSRVTTRYGASRDEIAAWVEARGEPRYRTDQIWEALYGARIPIEAATALPRALRAAFSEAFPLALRLEIESRGDDDQTLKWLWAAGPDGAEIETVLMRYPTRATVCVSSQAGCAMGCTFCATGQAGFTRQLDSAEIVEQVLRAAHESPQPVTNIVFMGMGEPLANYDAVWGAIERLHGDLGISARRITVSTVGIVPGMRRLAAERLPVTLAVSLHAPDDARREPLVPVNRQYPLKAVLDAAAEHAAAHGRRVSFEYACIEGVNDRESEAEDLAKLLRRFGALGAHVNLIPLNPTDDYTGVAPRGARIQAFAAALRSRGVNATVRRNRGTDIDAACGQLRRRAIPVTPGPARPAGSARMSP